jgi:hypothetical protein
LRDFRIKKKADSKFLLKNFCNSCASGRFPALYLLSIDLIGGDLSGCRHEGAPFEMKWAEMNGQPEAGTAKGEKRELSGLYRGVVSVK